MTTLDYFRELAGAIRANLEGNNADSIMVTWGQVTLRVGRDDVRVLSPAGQHVLPVEGDVSPELLGVLERIEFEGATDAA